MLPHRGPTLIAIFAAAGLACAARAQDSVPAAPGGNDALSPYSSTSQRVRYVVDAAPIQTSWGHTILVAPILKASRDGDPLFRTLILGSAAASPGYLDAPTFAPRTFSVWSTPGQGVHPSANAAPGSVAVSAFDLQLGVAASEFALTPSSILGATVGLNMSQPARLYVERVMAVASRPSDAGADTATLSLGAVDAAGNLALRADNFNTIPATATRVLGENILRVNTAVRGAGVNSLAAFGGANFAADAAATTYVVSNESIPTNTPTLVGQPGSSPFVLAYDFASRFRAGSTSANLTTTTGHLAPGVAGHRGNPTFSPFAGGAGSLGAIASLARPSAPAPRTATINVFDMLPGAAGAPPAVDPASRRAYALPTPLTVPGYSTNTTDAAESKQYLSQTAFRGGNGQVGLGRDAANARVLAFAVSDPLAGDSLAVVRIANDVPAWTVAAFPGQSVLSGPAGAPVGMLSDPLVISAPAVDLLGNVYFVAAWQPAPPQTQTGLFKAVNRPEGYRLELLLSTGQQVAGPNSGRTYTVSQLALADGDSIASGAFHSQQLVQRQLPGRATSDPASINAMGGLIVNTVLTYDNAGQSEDYDAVLMLLPGDEPCAADFDGNGSVQVPDIFAFLSAWFAQGPGADFDGNGLVQVPDIFAFLSAWFAGC